MSQNVLKDTALTKSINILVRTSLVKLFSYVWPQTRLTGFTKMWKHIVHFKSFENKNFISFLLFLSFVMKKMSSFSSDLREELNSLFKLTEEFSRHSLNFLA